MLILTYKRDEVSKTDINHIITYRYSINKKLTEHFDGRTFYQSGYTTTFDRSVFIPPEITIESNQNEPLYIVSYYDEIEEDRYMDRYR